MSLVNDFTIKIATINGTGSQTANQVLMRCFFKMNIPVGSKNFFPSNIQGMPTWFAIRVNQHGFTGAKENCDILINYNAKTLAQDLREMSDHGILFYDQETPLDNVTLPSSAFAIPYKKILDEMDVAIKYRKPVSNMLYVGAVSAYLDIPEQILLQTLEKHFSKNENALRLNTTAALKGREYFNNTYSDSPRQFKVAAGPALQTQVLMDGNTASAMGLLYGGCSFLSWYPITPSTSVVETYQSLAKKYRPQSSEGSSAHVIVQSEDELSAICMVLGAGWAGARALTATSGPGLSLMAEAAGYAYYAEIPSVIWDVQRAGPSTGLPTRTAQGDITFAHFLSHGDTKHVCLLPGTLSDCFEFGQACFDLAERLQTLVIVLSDLDLGMNLWVENKWSYPEKPFDRGKILTVAELEKGASFDRYKDCEGDGIPYRTLPGAKHAKAAYFTRGSGHNESAQYTENPIAYTQVTERLLKKWETAKSLVPAPLIEKAPDSAQEGILYYGALDAVVAEMKALLTPATSLNSCRLRALPFTAEVQKFLEENKKVYVLDQNRDGQMYQLLASEFPHLATKLVSLRYHDGLPVTAEKLLKDFNHANHAAH
ncbi:MAG: hypothetical protein OM95_12405 [Bdellovibrio sp. ArHS]|uniref:2-oxoacid:acceptor oxidoreductase subunit alpha n=1 Tax=Bdellovibrio sp. ArHS TaxID=1569284 RepID=UPI000582CF76|nr:2-oxoacid:acceptor oxidoreductase subunit alpha [Bdellovibrio sp. ArHS]KHD87805.1 MAG: hypothetical protein OM95_12405 [Bdellovibrio sp. ArHS]